MKDASIEFKTGAADLEAAFQELLVKFEDVRGFL
jgi:hypothetical protein